MFSKEKRCLCMVLVLIWCFTGFAQGENSAVLTEQEAVWEAGGYVTYVGSFQLEEDVPDAVWHAELKSDDPEKAGEILFTRILEDSIRKRKQSDTMTADAVKGENSFEMIWYFPEKTDSPAVSEISFRLQDGSGRTLVSGLISRNPGGENSSDWAVMLLERTNRLTVILLAAAGVIWVFALLRIILVRKRRRASET